MEQLKSLPKMQPCILLHTGAYHGVLMECGGGGWGGANAPAGLGHGAGSQGHFPGENRILRTRSKCMWLE